MKTREKLAVKILLFAVRLLLGYQLNGDKEKIFAAIEAELKEVEKD